MYKIILLILPLCLNCCMHLSGIEHSVYYGITRSHSGGETYTEESGGGHEEQSGGWFAGTMLKTIWKVR